MDVPALAATCLLIALALPALIVFSLFVEMTALRPLKSFRDFTPVPANGHSFTERYCPRSIPS